ncbi:MAG: phosphatidylserine decarboxylase [Gammaproteobacteria bacterium]|nr:phosphatidylserine decarboxylase [Gammaproteobacteria bacterium]
MKSRTLLQYFLPHHLMSRLFGRITNCRWVWLKNRLIGWFYKRYQIDMSDATEADPFKYETFNSFFTRAIRPETRPIAAAEKAIVSPVDGAISQIGKLNSDQLIQAKGKSFSIASLLSCELADYASVFKDGNFATIYLSPKDYHRVHMPLTGKLQAMAYIPGRLFSVNSLTAKEVPNLYGRNERVVTIFETAVGPMAVVLVGAMLVASITTVWAGTVAPAIGKKVKIEDYKDQNVILERGAEMGRFQFGSTVILLLPQNVIHWNKSLQLEGNLKVGQFLGA